MEVITNSFYQIDNKDQVNVSPTDANVYYLDAIKKENNNRVYYFNPMREYTFNNKYGAITKAGDKTPNIAHSTKKITETDLLTKYNIYKLLVQLNRGSFLSYVPVVGSSINTGLGFIPGSGLLTDTLNVTKNIGTGAANALVGRGYGKRKRRTKKNKRKTRKTRKINRKTRK